MAGAYEEEVSILWNETSTVEFFERFEQMLSAVGAKATGGQESFGAGEMLRNYQEVIRIIGTELEAQLGVAAASAFNIPGLIARSRAVLTDPNVPNLAQFRSGYGTANRAIAEQNLFAPLAGSGTTAAAQASAQKKVEADVLAATKLLEEAATLDAAKAANNEYVAATVKAATERNLLAALEGEAKSVNEDYLAATVKAATSKNNLAVAEAAALAADDDYLASTAALTTTNILSNAIREATLAGDQAYLESVELAAITKATLAAAEKEAIAGSSEYLVAQQRLNAATLALAAVDDEASGATAARVAAERRAVYTFNPVAAAATGGGLLAGAAGLAKTTLPLLVGFGAYRELKDSIQVAEGLQVQLAIIKSTLAEAGVTGSAAFESISDKITQVSTETATAADEVALIGRRLAGVFADPNTGTPDFTKGLSEAEDALKLSKVSGLPVKDITNDLVAIEASFDTSFKHIGDVSIGLAQRFGQSEADIVTFTSQLAPTAKELGFTFEQIAGLGAVAQEFSGVGGSQLAEQLRRILPGLQEKAVQIEDIFQSSGQPNVATSLVKDFATNNVPAVLTDLINGYEKLNNSQKNLLVTTAASSRQQGTLFTILANGGATLAALGTTSDEYAGDLDRRFAEVQDTVSFAFAQMKRDIEEFGVALFSSGLGEGLIDLARAGGVVLGAASELLKTFSGLNDATGGFAGSVLGLVLAFKGLALIWEKLLALRAGGLLTGLAGGAAGGAAAAEGIPLAAGFGGAAVVGGAVRTGAGRFLSNARFGNLGLDSLAGSSAFGGQLAGVLAVAAPIVATIAVVELLATTKKIGSEINNSKSGLVSAVNDALKRGVTPEVIRQQLATTGGAQNLSFLESAASFLTGQGADGPADVVNQTIQKYQVDITKKYLQDQVNIVNDFYKGLGDKAAANLTNAVHTAAGGSEQPGQAGTDPRLQQAFDQAAAEGNLVPGSDLKFAALPALPKDLQSRLDELLKNPDDPDKKKKVDDLIGAINANADVPQGVKDRITASQKEAQRILEALQKENAAFAAASAPELDSAITTAEAALATGSGSSDVLVAKLRERDVLLRQGIEEGLKAGNDVSAAVKSLASDIATISQQIVNNVTQQASINASIASLTGTDTPQNKIAAAKSTYEELISNSEVDAKTRIKAAIELATAEQDAFKQRVDSAKTEAEKLSLISKGFKFSNEARTALAEAELLTQQNQNQLTTDAAALGVSVVDLGTFVATAMTNFGKDAATILNDILQARLNAAVAKGNIDAFIGGITGDYSKYSDDIKSIVALDTAVKNVGNVDAAAPPTTGNVSASEQQQIQDAAVSTPQEDANAQLDIDAANAKGDAVRLAQIAQDRARVDAQFAVTNADRLEAIAHMVQADNDLVKAQQAYADSLRKVANAASGNDTLVVANNALGSAQAALDILTPGTEAYNIALAAYLDAQHGFALALLNSADAQENIEIAKATAAGDPVKAAKLKLDELQKRLSNAEVAGITGDQLANLEAQVITQADAVVQATISAGEQHINTQLTLMHITKQQAVAQLQALRAQAILLHANQTEIDQIDVEIKQLTDQLGQDFRFNLPSVLGLPSLYEARRIDQPGGSSSAYQDNRQFTVNIYAGTNASPQQMADAFSKVVGTPQARSTYARRFAT